MNWVDEAVPTGQTRKVSVIVPVYRGEQYLDECLETLVAQTHSEIEIVIVDDGSPDRSGRIAVEWSRRDKRIELVAIEHAGAAAARNAGLAVATGDYITFVDADDVVHPKYVEWLLDAATRTHADLVTSSLSHYPDGTAPAYSRPAQVEGMAPADMLERIVSTGVGFASCGKLVHSDVFRKVRYREGLPFEDLGVLPGLFAAATHVAETDAIGYGYRRYDGSTEGGHKRVLKTDLLRVLALNIADAEMRFGPNSLRARSLIVGYVVHAAKALEGQAIDSAAREVDFDATYRALVIHAAPALHCSDLSVPYKLALAVSALSPESFVRLLAVGRRLKSTVLPKLRRR